MEPNGTSGAPEPERPDNPADGWLPQWKGPVIPPPVRTDQTPAGGQRVWYPVEPAAPMQPPLPAYREPEPGEDTAIPKMITAVTPVNRERREEIEKQTQPPLWPAVLTGSLLLVSFSMAAIATAGEQSIPGAIATAAICMTACLAFFVLMLVVTARRQRDQRELLRYAAASQEAAGLIEVYADRAIKITPRTRTVVYFRRPETVVWESPRLLTISDGYAAIVWQAEELTVQALENLRRIVYPAIPESGRKSTGRTIASAAALNPLPDIHFTDDTVCRFRYRPNMKRETDRKIGILMARCLPFTVIGSAVAGALLGNLFRNTSRAVGITVFSLAAFCLLQGLATVIFWYQLRRDSGTGSPAVGIAFTRQGIAIEENGCLRFLPRGCYKSLFKRDILALQTPVGQLCIPWEDIPDPDLVKSLLTIGE